MYITTDDAIAVLQRLRAAAVSRSLTAYGKAEELLGRTDDDGREVRHLYLGRAGAWKLAAEELSAEIAGLRRSAQAAQELADMAEGYGDN